MITSIADIPERATIRSEYVGKNGPYLYAYWKEVGKLRKAYVGKSWEECASRMANEQVNKSTGTRMSHSKYKKSRYLLKLIEQNDPIAKEYGEKLNKRQCSVDWAYKRVREEHQFQLALRAVREMKEKGLDTDDINAVESYINSEFR